MQSLLLGDITQGSKRRMLLLILGLGIVYLWLQNILKNVQHSTITFGDLTQGSKPRVLRRFSWASFSYG